MLQEPARTRLFSTGLGSLHARGYTGRGVRVGHLDSGVAPDADIRLDTFRMFALDGFSSRSEPPSDPFGHGTATASLIAAAAPGADILSGAVFDGGAVLARMVLGLDWLADCAPDIVNLSFGIAEDCPILSPLISALTRSGSLVLAPAGNLGAGRASQPGLHPDVLTLGATTGDGRIAPFSGSRNAGRYGQVVKPDCAAPGVDVPVRMPDGPACHTGVSFACAQAAGVAAILKGACPQASPALLRQAMVSTAAMLAPEQAHRALRGEIRPVDALAALLDHGPACRPQVPPEEARWRDPRLLSRLASTRPGRSVEAVLAWSSFETRDTVTAPLTLRQHVPVRNAPMSILQADRQILMGLLDRCDVIAAGAVDLDLSAL